MPEDVQDILILGQGAAAYSAAIYAARYRVKTVMFGEEFGGETAIGGIIENYPGVPAVDGFDLMLKMKEQVDALEVPLVSENVSELRRSGDLWEVKAGDHWHGGRSVVICVGRTRRTLGLPNEKSMMGKGVSYCSTCDAPLYKNKEAVVVVGGGDSAVKGAILIAKYAHMVYLSYRGDKLFRPEPIATERVLNTPNIEVIFNSQITELKGQPMLAEVVVDVENKGKRVLLADGIFIEIGADPNSGFAKAVGVNLNEMGEIMVDSGMKTNIAGLFAAGDVSNSSGELKQTITASAQGAIAATSAYEYVNRQTRTGAIVAGKR